MTFHSIALAAPAAALRHWRKPRPPAAPDRRLAADTATAHGDGWLRSEAVIMGTSVVVELWNDDALAGRCAIDAVLADMRRIDATMSPHKPDSELSRINAQAASGPVALSDELFDLLSESLRFSELSFGAFDITYASAGQLYDYRRGIRPNADALATARRAIGYRHLQLDATARTVRFAKPGMRIDLGGFAKGHAVERARAILKQHGIAHAIVSAGGDSAVLGDRRGRPWTIAIRDPRNADAVVAVLPLIDVAISTSGDYERYFDTRDGVRCHHLIDPATGASPSSLHSVTIVAADGLTTEGLSKSVFVLGLERGMALVESLPGVDAVVVDAQGALHASSGWLTGSAKAAA